MLTQYGMNQWLPTAVILWPVAAACAWLAQDGQPIWWIPCALLVLIWLAFAACFREPPRRPSAKNQTDFLSPADGTISAVIRVAHHDATDGPGGDAGLAPDQARLAVGGREGRIFHKQPAFPPRTVRDPRQADGFRILDAAYHVAATVREGRATGHPCPIAAAIPV